MGDASFAPYWKYNDQDDPPRVRPLHDKVGNYFKDKVLMFNHPFWQIWFPPNDWGCRCWITNHTKEEVEENGWEIITELPKWLTDLKPGDGWGHVPRRIK